MPANLLSYATVHAFAATSQPGSVPPLALVAKVNPRANLTAPATLLSACVAVTAVPHPILDALLTAAGARRDRDTYVLPAAPTGTPTPALLAALAAAHPGTWRAARGSRVPDVLGPALVEALTAAGVAPTGSRPRRVAGMSLRITRAGNRLRITPATDGLTLAGRTLGVGAAGRVLLTPFEAVALVEQARAGGVVVLDADTPARFAQLERLTDRGCVIRPVPGAPGWADLVTGPLISVPATSPVPAHAAVDLARRASADARVAVAAAVTQAAAATAAADPAARRTSRPGLRPWQDLFVTAYLASGPGLVNALPPGAGKTVCAAAALAEHAAAGPRYRAVVLAPATLRSQWRSELGRFFPAARVCLAETSTDLAAHHQTWQDADEPVVLVLTPQLLARSTPTQALTCEDLVVDEATFLRNTTSTQAQAAWRLRAGARHAMVLSGTPDERGVDGTGALLAFARGEEDLFAGLPLSGPHPTVRGDRVGDLVFTGPHGVRDQLPDAQPRPVVHAPGAVERLIDQVARDRIVDLLTDRVSVPRLRSELDAWRLGLACPAALLDSNYALGQQVRDAGVGATLGVKGTWVLERTRAAVAAGGAVLIFADFATALEAVAGQLTAAGVPNAVVSSALTARQRAAVVERFTSGALPVLLIAATGQLGLNLQAAATVLHLDVPTTAATLLQRGARAARLGSDHAQVAVEVPVLDGCADQALFAQLSVGATATDPLALAHLLCGRVAAAA